MIFFDNTNMQIPYLPFLDSNDLRQAGEQLNKIDFHRIGQNNWPEQFPYTPYAAFTMAHNGEMLFIRFKVDETSTMALTREDNEQVCNDSCVEFFLAVDDSGYYNFEFTCIGKTLLGFRKERPAAVHAPEDIMASILRYSSLGGANFEETRLGHPWELTVGIPASALFRHNIDTWQGLKARINLYKCGDRLSCRHYLSWRPIDSPKPDFHTAPLFCCGTILKLSDERSSSIRIIPGPVSSFHHHPVVLAFPLSRPPAFPIYPPGDRIESTIQTHFRRCILCRLRLILFISALKQE